jgi:hypothetical protein
MLFLYMAGPEVFALISDLQAHEARSMWFEILYEHRITLVTIAIATGMAWAFWRSGGRSLAYYLLNRHPLIGVALSFGLFLAVLLISRYFSPNGISARYIVIATGSALLCALTLGCSLAFSNPQRARARQGRFSAPSNSGDGDLRDAPADSPQGRAARETPASDTGEDNTSRQAALAPARAIQAAAQPSEVMRRQATQHGITTLSSHVSKKGPKK